MYLACRRVKVLKDQRKAEMQKGTQTHASYIYLHNNPSFFLNFSYGESTVKVTTAATTIQPPPGSL